MSISDGDKILQPSKVDFDRKAKKIFGENNNWIERNNG
jgi:hypothetical protein